MNYIPATLLSKRCGQHSRQKYTISWLTSYLLSGPRLDTTNLGLRRPSSDLLDARKEPTGSSAHLVTTDTRPALTDWRKRCSEWRDKPSTPTSWISLIRQQTPMPSDYIHTWSRRRNTVAASVLCRAPMARRTHPQVGRRTSSTTNSPPSSLLRTKMICRSWSSHYTKRCLIFISTSTG